MSQSEPKCPVKDDVREWIDRRMAWLIDQFGIERLRSVEVVLPRSKYFPDAYSGTEEDVRRLAERVCGYMGVAPQTVDVALYYDQRPSPWGILVQETAGLYSEEDGRFKIWIEAGSLGDPTLIVATLAHELGHVLLLGHGRITRDVADHEPLTDLITVFFGMGIFLCDSALRERNAVGSLISSWSESGRMGYLTIPMLAYAFAVFAHARDEPSPGWARYLRPDARKVMKEGLQFLAARPNVDAIRPLTNADTVGHSIRSLAPQPIVDQDDWDTVESCAYCGVHLDAPLNGATMCEACRQSVEKNEADLIAAGHTSWDDMSLGARWAIACGGAVVFLICAGLLLRSLVP